MRGAAHDGTGTVMAPDNFLDGRNRFSRLQGMQASSPCFHTFLTINKAYQCIHMSTTSQAHERMNPTTYPCCVSYPLGKCCHVSVVCHLALLGNYKVGDRLRRVLIQNLRARRRTSERVRLTQTRTLLLQPAVPAAKKKQKFARETGVATALKLTNWMAFCVPPQAALQRCAQ